MYHKKAFNEVVEASKKGKKLPNVFGVEQLNKLVNVIDKPKVMMAVMIGFWCGLRINEVCCLKVRDINFEGRLLKVESGKGNKDGYVPIHPKIIPTLRNWLEFIGDSKYLFPSVERPYSHLNKKTLYTHYYKCLEKAGLREFREYDKRGHPRYNYYFHTLRHSICSYLIGKGIHLSVVKRFMRHEDIQTTEIYTHINPIEVQNAYDKAMGSVSETEDNLEHPLPNNNALNNGEEIERLKLEVENKRLEIERLKLMKELNMTN